MGFLDKLAGKVPSKSKGFMKEEAPVKKDKKKKRALMPRFDVMNFGKK